MAQAAESRTASVVDAAAMEIFQNQWNVYQKFLKHDYLANRAACMELHRFLIQDLARPFHIVDLACGDASNIVGALKDTPVQNYRGVDLSQPALAYAAQNLAGLSCAVELQPADFTAALRNGPSAEDVIWISLSLHHFVAADKLAFMRDARASLRPDGAFLVYEPTRRDGETRDEYLDRFEGIGRREWTGLKATEFAEALKHVRACDLPETVSDWHAIAREAGFGSTSELYRSPTDLFRLFLFRP